MVTCQEIIILLGHPVILVPIQVNINHLVEAIFNPDLNILAIYMLQKFLERNLISVPSMLRSGRVEQLIVLSIILL